MPIPRPSRARSASWPAATIPTPAPSRTRSSGSRRSPKPMACYRIRPGGRATTRGDPPPGRGHRGRPVGRHRLRRYLRAGAAVFGSLFERLFGPPAAGPPSGQDVHLDLVISLEEVLTGGTQEVTIGRPGPCPRCAGSGSGPGSTPRRCPGCGGTGQRATASRHGPLMVRQVITCPQCAGRGRVIDHPCPACEASGRAVREEKVTIRIPPGIPEGATLRLAGRGMPSLMPGDPPGDAYASIRTRDDPRFTRDGADLWHDLHVQAPDAALGVTAAVPVPEGQARVRVPPGTQPGSVLRVEAGGLPRYGGHGRGSLNLTVILDIPRRLSARQRAALRAAPGRGCRDKKHGSPIPRAARSPIRPEDNGRCGRAARRRPRPDYRRVGPAAGHRRR